MAHAVVFEQIEDYAAYVPDLPGCIATGKTREDVERKHPRGHQIPSRRNEGRRRGNSICQRLGGARRSLIHPLFRRLTAPARCPAAPMANAHRRPPSPRPYSYRPALPRDRRHVEAGESVTWRELESRSRDVAAGLIAMGVQLGDRVAISGRERHRVDDDASRVVRNAPSRCSFITSCVSESSWSRSAWRRAVCSSRRPPCCRGWAQPPRCVEHVIVLNDRLSRARPRWRGCGTRHGRVESAGRFASPAPTNLAAIIYTSGTTGGSKGVMISHRNSSATPSPPPPPSPSPTRLRPARSAAVTTRCHSSRPSCWCPSSARRRSSRTTSTASATVCRSTADDLLRRACAVRPLIATFCRAPSPRAASETLQACRQLSFA